MKSLNSASLTQLDSYPVFVVDTRDEMAQLVVDPAKTAVAIRRLIDDLGEVRRALSKQEWHEYALAFRDHPLWKLLLQDAFAGRAYRKPRGYAGDAVLMDMVYSTGDGALLAKASALGKRVYAAEEMAPLFAATRARVPALATAIDAFSESRAHAHILSVACGHLRELAISKAFKENRYGRFVGLDQDKRSLKEVERTQPTVERVVASIAELMDGAVNPGRFDFIYTAGLYDYLDDEVGRRLVHKLAAMIQPGGRILIANFLDDLPGIAYMEAVMDWWMVYRPAEQLHALAENLPGVTSSRVVADPLRQISYLEINF